MSALLVGYARCFTEQQDLTAQRDALAKLGVTLERIYVDHGLTGTNRERPGLREALAAAAPATRSCRVIGIVQRTGDLQTHLPAGEFVNVLAMVAEPASQTRKHVTSDRCLRLREPEQLAGQQVE